MVVIKTKSISYTYLGFDNGSDLLLPCNIFSLQVTYSSISFISRDEELVETNRNLLNPFDGNFLSWMWQFDAFRVINSSFIKALPFSLVEV